MPFGYLGTTPNQQLNNSGVFSVSEALQVQKDGEWGGSLQLIEEKSISGVSSAIFTDIKEAKYDVHFLEIIDYQPVSDGTDIRIRFYESGVLETASVYQHASQRAGLNPSVGFLEAKNTGQDKISTLFGSGTATGENDSGYAYFYNLGDSSKYSFATFQCVGLTNESYYQGSFGSAVLPQASTVDGIRILMNSGNYNDFKVSLYGIKEYS